MKPKNYIKLYKVGTSVSYKDVMEQFSGDSNDTKIGGKNIRELKGWWWAEPEARVTENDLKESKPSTIKKIIVIVDRYLYNEERHGRISKSGNIAFITQNSFSTLF